MRRTGDEAWSIRAGARWAAVISVAVLSACEPPPEDAEQADDIAPVEQAATTYPVIDFSPRPSYLNSNTVVLTFDDVPDDVNTAKVLDILKTNNIKAAFFINTNNFTDVASDSTAQAVIKRMVNEGHEVGNHTVDHPNLGTLSTTQIESEIAGVENTLRPIIGSRRLTLLRAPYGIPFNPDDDTSQLGKVAPIVAKHAVHIGWHIDSLDSSSCETSSSCIVNTVKGALKPSDGSPGAYGIILMHATHPATVQALQPIIDFIKANGYVFRKVEDVVRSRFGSTTASAELVDNLHTHVNRSAAADAFVYDASATTNFGTATTLDVKTSSAGSNRDAYLRYDISTISTITKAKLRIFARATSAGTNLTLAAYPVASTSWSETTITWSTRPAIGSTALKSVTVGGTSLAAYDLDVTSYVKAQKTAGKTAVSFALHCPSTVSPIVRVNARENGNSRPQLVVTP
jgi:peptidoglycan/xylan/chitin deacetylase (PgdA/CDA1 family)